MTLGITTPGTIVHIIMTLGIMVGLGVGVIPTIPGTQVITGGHITIAAGAGMEEAGMADIGDIHLVAMDIIEVDMLLQPILVAEVDGQAIMVQVGMTHTDDQTSLTEAETIMAE
jgi:hypothetical protein